MISRRKVIKSGTTFVAGMLLGGSSQATSPPPRPSPLMPDESHPHKCTWMAFTARPEIWSKKQIPEVKRNLALIANTIAQYEPVNILVANQDRNEAIALLKLKSSKFAINLVEFETDDFWLRDTGPVFVKDGTGERAAIDFNFNGWGNKQNHKKDSQVAKFIAERSGAKLIKSSMVLEGGCFEVDGQGNAIMTRSCILNENRNPGLSEAQAERELKHLLGLKKIIWLEGIKGRDITDGHTDFYARFIRPGEVFVHRENYRSSFDYEVTRENIKTLSESSDADGSPLKLKILDAPDVVNESFGTQDFAAGYVGYYVCNGAVISQKFGDRRTDRAAKKLLSEAFPGRIIEQIAIDGIASGGGSIHCTTQQEISAK